MKLDIQYFALSNPDDEITSTVKYDYLGSTIIDGVIVTIQYNVTIDTEKNADLLSDGWTLNADGMSIWRYYNNNVNETITLLALTPIDALGSSNITTINITEIGTQKPNRNIYGYDEGNSRVQVYAKENFKTIESAMFATSTMQTLTFPYPNGFDKYNTFVIGIKLYKYNSDMSIKKIYYVSGISDSLGTSFNTLSYEEKAIQLLFDDTNVIEGEYIKGVVFVLNTNTIL